jgi:hypothetical protein
MMSALLAACGGGSENAFQPAPSPVAVRAVVASVVVSASSATLPTDGSASSEIRVLVRDASNKVIAGVPVSFSATSGALVVTQATTDDTGYAIATLSIAGDATPRPITVTGSAMGATSSISGTAVINVAPTTITSVSSISLVSSAATIPTDGTVTAEIRAVVRSTTNQVLSGVVVAFSSTSGELVVTRGTTDASGTVVVQLSTLGNTTPRTISVTATASGISGTIDVVVGGTGQSTVSAVRVTSNVAGIPTDGTVKAEIRVVVVNAANQGIAGVPVAFAAPTNGQLSNIQSTTDSSGTATATLSTGGDTTPRTITVTATAAGISGSTNVTVATSQSTVAAVRVTSNVSSIPTDGTVTAQIRVVVVNANNQVISGVPVAFAAPSNGQLSNIQSTTDSSGTATATLSTGGDTTPRTLTVTATAAGISASTNVTVGGTYILSATTSTPSLQSDGSVPAEIRVYVRNASNQFVSGIAVNFAATSGGLSVTQGTTDANGVAIAKLTPASDPSRRTITVTGSANGASASVSVDVVGSTLTIQGPTTLTLAQQGTYTVVLTDASSRPIVGKTLTVTSSAQNTLTAASVTTDASGRATFKMTTVGLTTDTLTVSGIGLTATLQVTVDANSLTFTALTPTNEVPLGTPTPVSVTWRLAGVVTAGQNVTFSTTRGTVTAGPVVTDGVGVATATLSSTNAGGAIVTATAGSVSTTLAVEFVATTPTAIVLQPDATSIGPNQSTSITAVVRDANNNLVKNKTVVFTLTDVSGGSISVGSAVTDSQGRAQTVYTASSTTSGSGLVQIAGTVQGTAVTATTSLTVAQRQVFMALGTNNLPTASNALQYQLQFVVQVTDINGNAVANVPVALSILSDDYYKGSRTAGSPWTTTPSFACTNEDANRNGILDVAEDFNTNGRLDAGNIAVVTPATATTGADGSAIVTVTYQKSYAYWLDVTLSAKASVAGTESVRSSGFLLPGRVEDFIAANTPPPGVVSPFGTQLCSSAN